MYIYTKTFVSTVAVNEKYFISVVSAFIISEIYIRTNVNFFLIGHQVLVLIANSSSHYTLTIYVHMHILVKLFCMHYLQWQLAQLEQWQQKMPHTNTSDMMVNKPTTVRPVIFQNFVILFYAHTHQNLKLEQWLSCCHIPK